MAKGSQLAQLKSALRTSGVGDRRQQGKNAKKTHKSRAEDPTVRKAKLDRIREQFNVFDTKVTKVKHDVPGRKLKGVTGKPGKSRQAGLEERRKTLLPEYESRNRAGAFVDRRFGENDPNMTPEEKMLQRFTTERQRRSKGSMFNLDDDAGPDGLTHYGQSLSGLDDFDDAGLGVSDEEEPTKGAIDRRTVQKSHFGGFDDEEEEEPRKKSKADVMAEVMAKSKMHKAMRQDAKEADEDMRMELDDQLDDIRSLLLSAPPRTVATSSNDGRGPSKDERTTDETAPSTSAKPAPTFTEKPDDNYDQFVRELVYDRRAKPTDRLKTEEEIALEEKEKLEKAEKARLRRMKGEEVDSDDDDNSGRRSKKRKGAPSGDDLDDDFDLEDSGPAQGVYGLGAGLKAEDEEGSDEEGEGDRSDEEEEKGEEGSEGESGSDDEDDFADIVDNDAEDDSEGEGSELVATRPAASSSKAKGKARAKENDEAISTLPFTFPCPASHDEFLEILENVSDKDVPTVVQRIRVLHHPKLAEDNKFKLQAFVGILVDHVLHVTSSSPPAFDVVDALLPHIFALTQTYPLASSKHFVSKLSLMHRNLTRGLSRGPLRQEARTWPGSPELSLLRVIGLVWSTSDFSHPVVAPAELLMGQYLAQARIRGLKDLASGLFLCTLILQYEALSKRVVPEGLNFLCNALLILAPMSTKKVSDLPGSFPAPDVNGDHTRHLKLKSQPASSLHIQSPDLSSLLALDEEEGTEAVERAKVNLLATTFDLVGRFAQLYSGVDGFLEMVQPFHDILVGCVKASKLPEPLQKKHTDLTAALTRQIKFAEQARRALQLQSHKPIAIASHVPKFEEGYAPGRRFDPDVERAESNKLRALVKKERKGAIRELRKDARFLNEEKARRVAEKEEGYKRKMNKVMSELQVERSEQKQLERQKKAAKRRAGK